MYVTEKKVNDMQSLQTMGDDDGVRFQFSFAYSTQ